MSNKLRFWITNRFVWMSVSFLAWLFLFCDGANKELNLILFFIGFCLYCLAGAYLTDKPNPAERLTMRKFIQVMNQDNEED